MLTPRRFFRKPRFWRWTITLVLAMATFFALRMEIRTVFQWVLGTKSFDLEDPLQVRTLVVLAANLIGFFVLLLGFSIFVSQYVLPVQSLEERRKVFSRLWLYLSNLHGPAIFVKEGEKVATLEELQSSRPGVAFVDLASAIVLEKQWFTGGARTTLSAAVSGQSLQNVAPLTRSKSSSQEKDRARANARAAGPGLVFTEFGERVKGTVSLRKQFRGKEVMGSLRDGFEVSSFVFVNFSLGDPAEVLRVGYTGEGADNLRVILVDDKTRTIKALSNELEADDREEIHRFVKFSLISMPPLPQSETHPASSQIKQPFTFDERRVFNAVYGDAHLPKEDTIEDWTELPLKVAVETFHDLIAFENYDQLYAPDKTDVFPYRDEFKPRLARKVRNQGVLSFQFIKRKDGKAFEVGQAWEENECDIYPAQALRTSKVLRDRGVRVIFAGCGDLRPKDEVLHQRFLNWQAQWQSRYDKTMALYDYQAMQIRAHARAQAQKDMVLILSDLLKKSIPKDVLAISLWQSLEGFAYAPETKKLLPRETLGEFSNIQKWLLPGGSQPPPAQNPRSP